jgi:outer membrane protein
MSILRPYRQRMVSPVNLRNTNRLESLVRAGKLYLSAADVVALAIEDNLDIELQRYAPLLAREVLRRASGGGFLRDVTTTVAPGPSSVAATGVSTISNINGSVSATSGTAVISQIGPTLPSLDPVLFGFAGFGHSTSPQSNTVIAGTTAVITDSRNYQVGYQQQFLTGTNLTFQYTSAHERQNIPSNLLNPFTTANLDFQVNQNLLQGFGVAVNNRNIRVAKNSLKVSELQFRQQLITTISAVLNVYWDLVAFNESVRVAQQALNTANRLYEDNKKQVEIGTLAPIEVTRAEAEVATDRQNLLVAETNVLQQETILKNALSRNGVANPTLAEVRIVPLDYFRIPQSEDFPGVADLVTEATGKRPEIEQNRLNLDSAQINLVGSKNSLRPTLSAFAEVTNHGLTGDPNTLNPCLAPRNCGADTEFVPPYFVGGYSNGVSQIFRRNFPDYSAGFSLNIPLRNRAAQADYVTDQLQLRQRQLQFQKSLNQVRVDVENALVGVRQARAGYESAVKARILQQQTLDAEQKKYTLGASTVFQVIQDQRDLATAQGNEVQAEATYVHARIALDQALGRTLDANNVSVSEAAKGKVSRASSIPDNPPSPPDPNMPRPNAQ